MLLYSALTAICNSPGLRHYDINMYLQDRHLQDATPKFFPVISYTPGKLLLIYYVMHKTFTHNLQYSFTLPAVYKRTRFE